MNYILCRNRVRNFDYWKGVFDSHAEDHRAAGLKLVHLWYELTSPRNVFFLFEAEDIERARAFLNSSNGSATPHDSGLIEGEARFFSEGLGYGLLNDAESRAFAAAMESTPATGDANNPVRVEPVRSSPSPEPVKSAGLESNVAPERNAESEKRSTPSESSTSTEPTSTQPQTTEPAKGATAAATMKGPERAKSAPPMEQVDGFQPVENWPPAEAAAEAANEASESRRGRWSRLKY